MVDDDIVCRPWTDSSHERGLAVAGHRDPRVTRVFPCRQRALESVHWLAADLLGAHMALLGKSLLTLVAAEEGGVDFSDACYEVMASAAERRHQWVLATFCGIAGDSGTYCPYLRLFSSGTMQNDMKGSQAVFELALQSREVVDRTESHNHPPLRLHGVLHGTGQYVGTRPVRAARTQ